MLGLVHSADVYWSVDNYTAPIKKNLACRFGHMSLSTMREIIPTGETRAQQAGQRRLLYDINYQFPIRNPATGKQVGIRVVDKRDGRFWAAKYGSESRWTGPNGIDVVNTAQIERVD